MSFWNLIGTGVIILLLFFYIVEYPQEAKVFAKRMLTIAKYLGVGLLKYSLKISKELITQNQLKINESE